MTAEHGVAMLEPRASPQSDEARSRAALRSLAGTKSQKRSAGHRRNPCESATSRSSATCSLTGAESSRNPPSSKRSDGIGGQTCDGSATPSCRRFCRPRALEPFITPAIRDKGLPITFKLPQGGRASGYDAELLPEVCEVYLSAREADALPYQLKPIAKQAEIIMRGLARVGIIALVDEATGYQEVRARNALASILEAFIAKELQAYVQTFPPDFYSELFRLRGLEYPKESVKRPRYFGHLTNDIVYRRLAPGVLDELKRITPRDEKGRARTKYFQRLTSNLGYPKLREHLGSVVTIMKLSRDWTDFTRKLDQLHPRIGDTIPMLFDEDEPEGL